jgi:hypothetical protein
LCLINFHTSLSFYNTAIQSIWGEITEAHTHLPSRYVSDLRHNMTQETDKIKTNGP